jgi:hypothetical protein
MGFRSALTIRVPTLRLHSIDLLLLFVHSSLPLNRSCQSTCCCTHSQVSTLSHLISTARKAPIGHVQSLAVFSGPQARVADALKAKL